jgi:hypothetical protein
MRKYVVTGFDERYWQTWGASWLISLKEMAHHDPDNVVVVGFELSQPTKTKLLESGVTLLAGKPKWKRPSNAPSLRPEIFRCISDLAMGHFSSEPGIYAYWDADVFFQEDISEVFDLAKDNLVVTSNRNPGFLAGPHFQWSHLRDIQNIMSYFGDTNEVHSCLLGYFEKFVTYIDPTWNFTDIPRLKDVDDKLTCDGKVQKAIHLSGPIKMFLPNRGLVFWERHKDLYQKFMKKKSSRKLVAKSVLHTQ